jgi:hypothetical protein
MPVTCAVAYRTSMCIPKNRRSETYDVCPRTDTHLTYMIDIPLTMEFTIPLAGSR